MSTLIHLLHSDEEVLAEARISSFVMFRGLFILLAYLLLCGGLIVYLEGKIPNLGFTYYYHYYTFADGFARICNYISYHYPKLSSFADALKLLTAWPVFLLVIIASMGSFLQGFFYKIKTEMMVTNFRVMAKFGWVARDIVELHLHAVQDLTLTQSALGRAFNFGSIHMRGYAGVIARVDFISDPFYFRETALEEVERVLQGKDITGAAPPHGNH